MRRALPTSLFVLLVLLVGVRTETAGASTRTLRAALESRLLRANLKACRYGIAVLTREAHPDVVFARGHTRSMIPASTAKVLTAAAALDLLGPCHTFTTTLSARGVIDSGGTLEGDLVIHGSGDPNLSGRFHGGKQTYLLRAFTTAVRKAGIGRVTGALVLDDGPFDRAYVHPSWTSTDRARWYGAPVAGLAFNDSCADIVVTGARQAGSPATVISPSTVGAWKLESQVKTIHKGRTTVGGLWVKRGTALRVKGSIQKGISYSFSQPVQDPLRFFGGALLRTLESAGVSIAGGVRPAGDTGDRRIGATVIGRHGSGLGPTLEVMNRRSQNFYASLVFKACGAKHEGWGTWKSGEHAVGEMLRRRGLDPDGKTRIVDGSGLSRDNRTTAATLARLLHSYDRDLLRGPMLYDSLAMPGGDGTLRKRLRRHGLPTRLHAKTGTLGSRGVYALAGYIDATKEKPGYVFAILLNGVPGGRSLIDDLVVLMAKQ